MNSISAAANEAAQLSLQERGDFCSASTAWVLITSHWFNTHDPRLDELVEAIPLEFLSEYNRRAEMTQ